MDRLGRGPMKKPFKKSKARRPKLPDSFVASLGGDEDGHRDDDGHYNDGFVKQGNRQLSHREKRKKAKLDRKREIQKHQKEAALKKKQQQKQTMKPNSKKNDNNKNNKQNDSKKNDNTAQTKKNVTFDKSNDDAGLSKTKKDKKNKENAKKAEAAKDRNASTRGIKKSPNNKFVKLLQEQGLILGDEEYENEEDREIARLEKLIGAHKAEDDDGLDFILQGITAGQKMGDKPKTQSKQSNYLDQAGEEDSDERDDDEGELEEEYMEEGSESDLVDSESDDFDDLDEDEMDFDVSDEDLIVPYKENDEIDENDKQYESDDNDEFDENDEDAEDEEDEDDEEIDLNEDDEQYMNENSEAPKQQLKSSSFLSIEVTDDRLKRQIRGILNKMSAQTLMHFATEIETMYETRSRNEMTSHILAIMVEDCSNNKELLESLALLYPAMVAVLHSRVGNEIGAKFMELVVTKFIEAHKKQEIQLCRNYISVLNQLCNFQVVHPVLICDIIQTLLASFKDLDIELILMILKGCGPTIRAEDPRSLKEIVQQVQDKAEINKSGNESARVLFMLDAIKDLKDNRQKIVQTNPQVDALRKAMKGVDRLSSTLRVTLEDIREADARGRWWVLGSAWVGHRENVKEVAQKKQELGITDSLLALAKENHMNTDIRKSVFCVIMSAEDYMDAFEKLTKLNLKGKQDREIVHVLMHCCCKEKVFNPYYFHLAQKLCEFDNNNKLTLQFIYFDKFKQFKELDLIEINNLALIFAHLVGSGTLSISILKAFDFENLESKPLLFLRLFFSELFTKFSSDEVMNVFKRITKFHLMQQNQNQPGRRSNEHIAKLEFEFQELQDRLLVLFSLKRFNSITTQSPKIKENFKTARVVLKTLGGPVF